MTADPAHASMLAAVLAPPRHRAELVSIRRELAARLRECEGEFLVLPESPRGRVIEALRARERELSHEDDLPRLIYAEWLDERSESAECPVCHGVKITMECGRLKECPRCRGAGRVCEGAERASFIRLQCELARLPACGHEAGWQEQPAACPGCRAGTPALRRRERELAERWISDWAVELPVSNPTLTVGGYTASCHTLRGGWEQYELRGTFRRGFVDEITLDSAAFLRHADALTAAAPLRTVRLTDRPRYQAVRNPDGSVTCWLVGRYRDRAVVLPHEVAAVEASPGGYAEWLLSRHWPLLEFELPVVESVDLPHQYFEYDDRMPGGPDPVHRGSGPRPGRLGL